MRNKLLLLALIFVVIIGTSIMTLALSQSHHDMVQIGDTIAKIKCSDFKTEEAAQTYAASHPADKKRLDRDHDGLVCEALPK